MFDYIEYRYLFKSNRNLGLQIRTIYNLKKEMKKFIKSCRSSGIKIPRELLKYINYELITETDWEVIQDRLDEATIIAIVEDYILDKVLVIYKNRQARGLLSEEVVKEIEKFARAMFGKHKYTIQ